MARKIQGPHLQGYFDFHFASEDGALFFSVQAVPQADSSVVTSWWVSGLGESWIPNLLLKLEFSMASATPPELKARCKVLASEEIARIASISAAAGGMITTPPQNSPEVSASLAKRHFKHHISHPRFSLAPASLATGTLYLMSKAFGVKNPIQFISREFEVKASTVTRRLTRFRDDGLIPKLRSERIGGE